MVDLSPSFWSGKPRKSGYSSYWRVNGVRDQVSVEGDVVRYLLWGNEVTTWNRKNNILIVDDCGWQTRLTMDRLNDVLYKVGMYVYSERGRWLIFNRNKSETYVWEGSHTINLDALQVTPGAPKKFNEKISEGLKKFHEKGRTLVENKRFLTTTTLDGIVYVFVNKWYRRLMTPVLTLLVHRDNFETYKGMVATTKIYSAFIKNNAMILQGYLAEHGHKIPNGDIVSELKDFGVKIEALPEHVVSKLGLIKLLEG